MPFNRLGITSFMVDEGLVRLEEVRGDNGALENIFVRVCHPFSGYNHHSCQFVFIKGRPRKGAHARPIHRRQASSRTPSPQEHCRWSWRKGVLYRVDHATSRLDWRSPGCCIEDEAAPQDHVTSEYLCCGWRSGIEGLPAYPGWCDRELDREEHLIDF